MSPAERLNPPESQVVEQLMAKKRKKFAAILAGCALFMAVTIHDGGFRFFPSKINLQSKTYEQLTNPFDGNAYILTENFLKEGGTYEYAHRAGNTLASIDEAFRLGANIIDLDLAVVDDEKIVDGKIVTDYTIYVEHGLVKEEKIPGTNIKVTLVMDPNEVQLSTEPPLTFDETVKYIATKRDEAGREVCLNLEYKHGPFTGEVSEEVQDTLFEYNMPAIIQPNQQDSRDRIDTIRAIYSTIKNISAANE